jgi:hypothetical protein
MFARSGSTPWILVLRLDSTVRRVPLLSGSRVVIAPVGDDDVLLRSPPPPEQIADTTAAVRDALRFPLSGPPLEEIARAGKRATIVVEPPGLPYPGAQRDPREDALASAIAELERSGVAGDEQTILVAGGLGRRLGRTELERLFPPRLARSFRGRVVVHDAEAPELVPIATWGEHVVRVHRVLVETDLVLMVTAAETVVHGGPATLLAACDAATTRTLAGTDSLLEAASAPEWDLALAVESAIAGTTPLVGVSLALDHPRLTGALRGYPDDDRVVESITRSWSRTVFSFLPGALRRGVLDRQPRSLAPTAAFAGPPSIAHAETLLRGVALRGTALADPVDALVVGVPWVGPHMPREPTNPITAAAIALGLALRLRRDAFPVRPDGTLVLLHPLTRSFGNVAQIPYRQTFEILRTVHDVDELGEAERRAAVAESAITAYRAGKACHPLLPYADWAGCAPALARLGRVVVAGCRDALAARTLGFVPTRGVASALEMAHGVAGGRARIGIVLGPPYPPLLVGS